MSRARSGTGPWVPRPYDVSAAQDLATSLNVSPLLGRLLAQRGITDAGEARRFLYGRLEDLPDPNQLDEMDLAVSRLVRAVETREKVLLFGDYDVDGITGTAQLTQFLREVGLDAEPLLPNRMTDGYGLTEGVVRRIAEKRPSLVVTIDNGTRAHAEIASLREAGAEVLVIDHHETPGERPPVCALINPKRTDSRFPEREIASAGLVFLLLVALRRALREKGHPNLPNLKRYLELAAIGTVADIVPLKGTNRLIVKYGLKGLADSRWPGLRCLMTQAQVKKPVGVGAISFRIAPRLNAAGRLEDPRTALELILCADANICAGLSLRLESLNARRQRIEGQVLEEAVQMIEGERGSGRGLVVAHADWPIGVVGIVASRLAETYGRPAIVLTIEGTQARGSGRTIPGLSIYAALSRIADEMTRFGGHHAAAGLTLPTERIGRFRERFDEAVAQEMPDIGERLPSRHCDGPLPLDEINPALLEELALLEPHGAGNPSPVFLAEPVRFEASRIVGGRHLKATLSQREIRLDAIGFGQGEAFTATQNGPWHRVSYTPQWNEYNGVRRIQLNLVDFSQYNNTK